MNCKKYVIMHGNKEVALIRDNGICKILQEKFLPFNLYLEETGAEHAMEIDVLVNNVTNFYYWCASRLLTLDRKYAKEILNSINVSQASTDKDRAKIALSYHCLSLTDIYWVKEEYEKISFDEMNLYENHLSSSFVDVSLKGKQLTIQNSYLIAEDLGTQGYFPKAWIREPDGFYLLKDGGEEAVKREILASKICQCFQCNQVIYESFLYKGKEVSKSKLITSLDYSIVSYEYFSIYAVNHEINVLDYIETVDRYSFHMMNILDYLIGNTDRHWANWGFFIDNKTNTPIRLYDLMDFNKSFESYDTLEGTNCLTIKGYTQKEAAILAVKKIGLNQKQEVEEQWFDNKENWKMFQERLNILKLVNTL